MNQMPTLKTDRLILRPFSLHDAPEVQRLAGEFEIADTTLNIPHPYEDGMAEEWIKTHQPQFEKEAKITLAITRADSNSLLGVIGLTDIKKEYEIAELGYWIGKPFWNNGYCTEAGLAMLNFAFSQLGLNKVVAHHLKRNPASGRVMQKLSMTHEGSFRQQVKRWGKFEDLEAYGILKNEFNQQT